MENAVLSHLLQSVADSSDRAGQQKAILQLAMFLEMRNRPVHMSDPHFYEKIVPAALRSVSLTDDDQREIISELCRLILAPDSAPNRIALFFPLCSTASWLVITPLLDLFLQHRPNFDEEETRQILVALRDALDIVFVPYEHPLHPHVRQVVRAVRERDIGAALAEVIRTGNWRTAQMARTVQDQMDRVWAFPAC